ncbi:MAG: PAS domain S-box protein [Candidatus Hydrogenedentes bacterium]|nr:PAS domain S-box protein [Candidatus Hydrogenedentota bacterium]
MATKRRRYLQIATVLFAFGALVFWLSFVPTVGLNSNFYGDLCELIGTAGLLVGANIIVRILSRTRLVTTVFLLGTFFLLVARLADFLEEVPFYRALPVVGVGGIGQVLLERGAESLGYIGLMATMLGTMYELAAATISAEHGEQRYRQLFQSAQYLAQVVDQSADAVLAVDEDGRVHVWSTGAERLLGYTKEEAKNLTIKEILVEGLDHSSDSIVNWVRERGALSEIETVAQRKNGARFAAGVSLSPLPKVEGQPAGISIIVRDIEERKVMERELLASRNLLAGALQAADVGLFIIDRDGQLVTYNTRARDIVGFDDEEMAGRISVETLSIVFDNPTVFTQALFDSVFTRGKHEEFRRILLRRKDGATRICNGALAPVFDDKGKIIAAAGVVVDITEREELQTKLLEAQKMESVGRLAGGVAHDFNNLLAGVLGYASLIQEELGSGSPHRQRLKTIEESALRASDLTRQLLTFARGGARHVETVLLNEIVTETLALLSHTLDPNIRLRDELDENLDAVQADRTQMGQVLMNLCLNSRDAIEGVGEIRITTENIDVDEAMSQRVQVPGAGRYVRIAVEDSGRGMSYEVRQKMFDPFFSTKKTGEGYGLGLSVVYGIVKSHNGGLLVDSEPMKGTRIEIYLPSSGPATAPAKYGFDRKNELRGGSETVLVVDDEQLIRALVRDILETSGYTVIDACTGEEGVLTYEQHRDKIDLIIMDMVMPGMGGAEALKQILAHDPNARCIVSSGYSTERYSGGLLDGRNVRFVAKPFHTAALISTVRTLLDS